MSKKSSVVIDESIVEDLAMKGLTKEQVGDYYGITKQRINDIFNENENLRMAYDRGQAIGIAEATTTLMELVKKGNVVATLFYLKTRGGWIEKQHVKGVKSTAKEFGGVRIFLPDNGRNEIYDKSNPDSNDACAVME